jgi:hypothetical protein
MQLSKEFGKKDVVLGRKRDNPQPPVFLRGTNIGPSHLTLTAIASFFARQQKSAPTLIDCLNHTSGQEPAFMA